MTFRLAIIGRPNVGKSTLFNRLAGKKLALVDNTPGVTRDWRAAPASLADLKFEIVDTAGLEEAFDASLEARMRRQTEVAFEAADAAVLMLDARAGVTPLDKHFADWIRKKRKPIILVANKCEGKSAENGIYESYGLGLGEPVTISAEHGAGMAELYQAIRPHYDEVIRLEKAEQERLEAEQKKLAAEQGVQSIEVEMSDEEKQARAQGREIIDLTDEEDGSDVDDRPIQVAIVGRPNAGKSTLLNALINEERVLTGPEAGMTRDAITVEWEYEGRQFKLVDTAGMRKRAKVDDKIEKLSVSDGLRAVRLAQVVVLVVDANKPLDTQDIKIARHVIDEGRALVIAVNKWDIAEDRDATLKRVKDKIDLSLSQVKGIPAIKISALQGRKLDHLMDAVLEVYGHWNRRISTAKLNRWLADVTEAHPPPLSNGRRIKIRYVTQFKTRPPTFALWITKPVDLPDTYMQYLLNCMRRDFELPAVPIRLIARKGKNPYVKGGK